MSKVGMKILKSYLKRRLDDPLWRFRPLEVYEISKSANGIFNANHPIFEMKSDNREFEDKGESDNTCLEFWNEIFNFGYFSVNDVKDLKISASEFVKMCESKYKGVFGLSESQTVRYVIAQSVSSFIGIQNPKKSTFAMNSIKSTIKAHADFDVVEKPWLIKNLKFAFDHVSHFRKMDKSYTDLLMNAKTSSSSIKGKGNFRDFVFQNSLESILDALDEVPLFIYLGTRSDRRGKFRLICSFDGRLRVVDFLLNNGSYDLCEGDGILAKFTTEGYNNEQLWEQMAIMSDRANNKIMVCIDYKGYDTQISLQEYLSISLELNKYRINDPIFTEILNWYRDWMIQPKPLLSSSAEVLSVLVPVYQTLASGLHGTHSFENLIGISTMLEAAKRGVKFYGFWSNGDDQNALISKHHLNAYIEFLNQYFRISWEKSLINNRLTVWSKLWFATDFHPCWEIGTIRSIWEREGGEVNFVESSKFQSNYTKILQAAIILIRLGYDRRRIMYWIEKLSDICEIDPYRIPKYLNNLNASSNSRTIDVEPHGLMAYKGELMAKTFRLKSLNVNNYFDMFYNMFKNRIFYNLNVNEIEYHDQGLRFGISKGIRYNEMIPRDVPWLFKRIYTGVEYPHYEVLNRDFLQGTKSYDGLCSRSYVYSDMYTLALAINDRNRYMWNRIVNK
jgi:hypothetical protein